MNKSRYDHELRTEKVINEKSKNKLIELKHRNALLKMENDIIGDRLNILTEAIKDLGNFQEHELKVCSLTID